MRIARALALGGIDSRRKCEIHVRNGAVTVNGEVVRDLGRQVDPDQDVIMFRGRMVDAKTNYVYFLLNKPEGYTTTAYDPHAEKTVYDLLPKTLIAGSRQPKASRTRVFPVGRLDKNSTGLLLMTNDGELANRLTHPRYEVGKWYEIKLGRALDPRDRGRLLKGVELEDGLAKAEKVRMLTKRNLQLLIREGKKREVRRIFEALGYEVIRLCRVAFGPLMLGSTLPGRGRFLTKAEIRELQIATGLIKSGSEGPVSLHKTGEEDSVEEQ
ncbi:MAG: rRNA pseudouridine synthase [Candidatus Omnitrophica bacterium]|nr:rRNA pseudouridine synthase [Candidatus Omnitrophota bacterium]